MATKRKKTSRKRRTSPKTKINPLWIGLIALLAVFFLPQLSTFLPSSVVEKPTTRFDCALGPTTGNLGQYLLQSKVQCAALAQEHVTCLPNDSQYRMYDPANKNQPYLGTPQYVCGDGALLKKIVATESYFGR